jgi:hypothetical protein
MKPLSILGLSAVLALGWRRRKMLTDKNIGSKNIRPLSTVAISLLIGCISSAALAQTSNPPAFVH